MVKPIYVKIDVAISKLNGQTASPDMMVLDPNIVIEGTLYAEDRFRDAVDGEGQSIPGEIRDITSYIAQIYVRIGNGSNFTDYQAISTNNSKKWSTWATSNIAVPYGYADGNGRLTLSVHAIYLYPYDGYYLNYEGTQNLSVIIDNTDPSLTIVTPQPDETFVLTGDSVKVPLELKATDNSGIKQVKWSLNGSDFQQLVLDSDHRARTEFFVTEPQLYKIDVEVTDIFNRLVHSSLNIEVVPPYSVSDPENVTGAISYLGDLLKFCAKRIDSGSGSGDEDKLPNADDFGRICCQRYILLANPENRAMTMRSVQQSRIAIEVLRDYITTRQIAGATTASPAYLRRAYEALLNQLGTSIDEIRQAAYASEDSRLALADRLGIGADNFQSLVVTGDQFTETVLENLFGFADTTTLNDPFAPNAIPPLYLRKRRVFLRAQWRRQDDAVRGDAFPEIPVPILDPDRVYVDDLLSQSVKDFYNARKSQLDQFDTALRQLPGSGAALFESAVELGLGAGQFDHFKVLVADYRQGSDIDEPLKALYLENAAFVFLQNQYSNLIAGLELLSPEWDSIFAILVQVKKLRDLYTGWRQEEVNVALTFGPDDFATYISNDSDPLPARRSSSALRQDWEHRLKARVDADAVTREQLIAAVAAAETAALPLLREQLLNIVAQAAQSTEDTDIAEQLTRELFFDFKASGQRQLTRIDQALETLQSLMAELRRERLATRKPVVGNNLTSQWRLNVDPEKFDEEWQWMSDFAAWRSAMNIFLFPENFLDADNRQLPPETPINPSPQGQSVSFHRELVLPLTSMPRITNGAARELAAKYLSAIRSEIPEAETFLQAFVLREPTSLMAAKDLRVKSDHIVQQTTPNATKFQDVREWAQEVFYFVPMLLAKYLTISGDYTTALDWYRAVYAHTMPGNPKIYKGLELEEDDPSDFALTDDWLTNDFNPHKIAQTRGNVYTRHTVAAISQCLLSWADELYTQETPRSLSLARIRYSEALDLLYLPVMRDNAELDGKVLENSLVGALRKRGETNLSKLRSGLNIAGQEMAGQSSAGSVEIRRPTPYRYQTLIERAKQLTSLAGEIEASFLTTLEKFSAESYTQSQANQALEISNKQVELESKRNLEATDSIELANLQLVRSQFQVGYYSNLIGAGLNSNEREQLNFLEASSDEGLIAGIFNVASQVASFTKNPSVNSFSILDSVFSTAAAYDKASSELAGIRAGFDRRAQEWAHQLATAQQDQAISLNQVNLAKDQFEIVKMNKEIAESQQEHARQMVNFLNQKFTGVELYRWMAQVLQRVYAYFLQQATATARLAETQLRFERQQALPVFIQTDYWQLSGDGGNSQSGDQRGMTGSVRLLQDITELDQYAFLSNSRKLQMSKTFSLAALSPIEFQRFKDSGVMRFNTAMALFDRDFPGHYLRLIRQVRTSVVALIPPMTGIHATLTNLGVSRIVVDDGGFRPIEVHHGMQSVALTGAVNATGVFELNQQPEFLMPFESVGVDTFWELRMPKAANPFDFTTIGDVLVTLDYTALDSWQYRKQVIQSLPTDFGADRSFGLRDQFPDLWYDLNHADQAATPNIVQWDIAKSDFPANALDVSISQLVLYFVGKDGLVLPELPIKFLGLDNGNAESVGGAATAVAGIASSRRGNAASWLALQGKSPVGRWHLDLSDRLADGRLVSQLIADESIADILFVVSYSARYPAWSA